MNEMDCVEVLVEKKAYAKDGVHKGMNGWICDPRCIEGFRLVNFPQYGEKEDIVTLAIKEEDLSVISEMNAERNEQIKAHFTIHAPIDQEEISDYLI